MIVALSEYNNNPISRSNIFTMAKTKSKVKKGGKSKKLSTPKTTTITKAGADLQKNVK